MPLSRDPCEVLDLGPHGQVSKDGEKESGLAAVYRHTTRAFSCGQSMKQ